MNSPCTKCASADNCRRKTCPVWEEWFSIHWLEIQLMFGAIDEKEFRRRKEKKLLHLPMGE